MRMEPPSPPARPFLPAYANRQRFNGPLFALYVTLHLLLLAAPFTFSWPGLITGLGLYFLTICLGITLCYHRLLAHRSYQTHRPVRWALALLGCLALQRGPLWWSACHRLHHAKVDRDGDPHSPSYSFFWSHYLWPFFWHPQLDESQETTRRLAPDLYADPGLRFLEKHYTTINALFLVLLFGVGFAWGGLKPGLSLLMWGGLVRIAVCLNITWLVNSVAHLWGYRNYETPDTSRNVWWVALLTYGEGWHNNHHADQRAARNGHRWFELDVTYWIICLMRLTGMAYNVIPLRRMKPPVSLAAGALPVTV